MPTKKPAIVTDPIEAAKAAHLRYVDDDAPGIRREKHGKGFVYLDTDGKKITDDEALERFKKLAIPPAWTDVWICPSPNGHIQATGRDAKGRKQYRYHPRWRETRSQNNFSRMLRFGQLLPKIRERVEHDLKLSDMPREKVLALVIRLLETTLIRIGNVEYAKANQSFGLTTMRDKHVEVSGAKVHFEFKGKNGQWHAIEVQDKRLARLVKKCREIPGHELFQYYDEVGNRISVGSGEVNAYLREISGEDFTAKDFRTWGGTVLAVTGLCECEDCKDETPAQKHVVEAIKNVAQSLGNTPSVCRKHYINPVVIESYLNGELPDALQKHIKSVNGSTSHALNAEEATVLSLLKEVIKT